VWDITEKKKTQKIGKGPLSQGGKKMSGGECMREGGKNSRRPKKKKCETKDPGRNPVRSRGAAGRQVLMKLDIEGGRVWGGKAKRRDSSWRNRETHTSEKFEWKGAWEEWES